MCIYKNVMVTEVSFLQARACFYPVVPNKPPSPVYQFFKHFSDLLRPSLDPPSAKLLNIQNYAISKGYFN